MKLTKYDNLVIYAIEGVPDGDLWGIVIYFFVTPSGKLAYEYSGSYVEFGKNAEHVLNEEFATFEKLKEDINKLKKDKDFTAVLNYDFGTHVKYGTDGVRISRKMR